MLEFAGSGIPQPDEAISIATGECLSIQTERNARNTAGVSGEQCRLLVGSGIVEPNPDGTHNRQQGAIGRIRNIFDAAFAEAKVCAFR